MTQKDITLLRAFFTQCLDDGCYCFEIQNVLYVLDDHSIIDKIIDAVLGASQIVQTEQLEQARRYINTFSQQAA